MLHPPNRFMGEIGGGLPKSKGEAFLSPLRDSGEEEPGPRHFVQKVGEGEIFHDC